METKELKISAIKPNPSNPRVIKDYKFHKLVKSLLVLPQMMELRPIVVNNENIVLGGNMRLKALQHIASLTEADRLKIMQSADNYNQKSEEEKVQICEFWHKFSASKSILVCIADSLTDAEQREFIVKDNAGFGEWDWEELANEWDSEELNDWGVDMPDFSVEEDEKETEKLSDGSQASIYYEPENKDIELADCIDSWLFEQKIKAIEESELTEEQKQTLTMFAYRFLRIDFENVANYYFYKASEEEKQVMERLRLVLTDNTDGFVEDELLKMTEI